MAQTATITDKRQCTILVEIYRKLGFHEGGKVIVSHRGNKMIGEDAEKIVDRLACSVTLPKQFRGMPVDTIIRKAKEEYFRKRV